MQTKRFFSRAVLVALDHEVWLLVLKQPHNRVNPANMVALFKEVCTRTNEVELFINLYGVEEL